MSHPFLQTDFEIQWDSLTPDHIVPDITKGLEDAKNAIDALCAIPENDATYENAICGLEKALLPLSLAWGKVSHLTSVCDSPEIRKAYSEVLPKVSAFFSSIHLNSDLWKVIKAVSVGDSAKVLNAVQKRFVDETVADFVNAGADLGDDKKKRISEIDQKLSELTQKYSENALDSLNKWELVLDGTERLAGVPENAVETLRKQALDKGYGTEEAPKYLITLHVPIMQPIMMYADDSELRKEILQAARNVARQEPYENKPLVKEILALRHEKAQILGKKCFPDFVLQRRMAKDGKTAFDFISNMHDRIEDAYKKEIDELEAFVAEKTGATKKHLNSWDTGYWNQKLRKERYDFDPEEVRPYFPMENVINGMFEIMGKLFGIRVVKRTENKPQTWHPGVDFYDIFDKSTEKHLGSFYTDWFPRSSKRSGAWMNELMAGERTDNEHTPHLGLMCGNMTPPVTGKPALLTHREVETVFHEFGHLLHLMLSEVEIKSLAGTNVSWDFVELPSQINENWCWERETLDIFARHYETGETIPEELFEKMQKSRNFGEASFAMRQLNLGMLDISLHYKYDELKDMDVDEAARVYTKGYEPIVADEVPPMIANFGHLFSDPVGYASGYYSYKWAEVLDADAFTRFKKEGILNEQTGADFRRCVLSKGNSEDPAKLFRDFMGREPDSEALLIRSGLA
jgi:oligopeptidase A